MSHDHRYIHRRTSTHGILLRRSNHQCFHTYPVAVSGSYTANLAVELKLRNYGNHKSKRHATRSLAKRATLVLPSPTAPGRSSKMSCCPSRSQACTLPTPKGASLSLHTTGPTSTLYLTTMARSTRALSRRIRLIASASREASSPTSSLTIRMCPPLQPVHLA